MNQSNSLPELNDPNEPMPVTLGQIGMWVFISTEVMLFAALIVIALIARLSIDDTVWPIAGDMHVGLAVGMLNTVLLVLSGVSAFSAVKQAWANRPMAARCLLALTIFLGGTFLVIKGYEYLSKYRLGLFSFSGTKQIYQTANREYISVVDQQLRASIAQLERRVSNGETDSADQDLLDRLYELQTYMSNDTAQSVGRSDDKHRRDLQMKLMAHQIYAHPDTGLGLEDLLTVDLFNLTERKQLLDARLELARKRLPQIAEQVKDLENPVNSSGVLGASEQVADSGRLIPEQWLEVKRDQQTRLAVEIENLDLALKPIDGRLKVLDYFADPDYEDGFNVALGLRLPVVITNGHAWMSNYLILTGMHTLHLIGGLLLLLWFLPRQLDSSAAPSLYVAAMYWQFVDLAWLAIFWIIYF